MNQRLVGLFGLLMWWAGSGFAQEIHDIQFAKGASSVVVADAVVRGSRHYFAFSARKGQWAQISVTAIESNAAITVWRPGVRTSAGDHGDPAGQSLPGAGEGDDASQWRGRLPDSGRYLIVVGPIRGNATYKLQLEIRRRPLSVEPSHSQPLSVEPSHSQPLALDEDLRRRAWHRDGRVSLSLEACCGYLIRAQK